MPKANWQKKFFRASFPDELGQQFYYKAWLRISKTHIRYLGRIQNTDGKILIENVFFVLPVELILEELWYTPVSYRDAGELLLIDKKTDIGYAAGIEPPHNERKEASKL